VIILGFVLVIASLRPPFVPELLADGVAMLMIAMAYRSRKRTFLGIRQYSEWRRRLEYMALFLGCGEMILRPGSIRYEYNIWLNLSFALGGISAYIWLSRLEPKGASESN
jgi:hypothetical protein